MCVVSMIGDHYRDRWTDPYRPMPYVEIWKTGSADFITREEFEALRKEVLEMKELLLRAKQYDEDNNEPECEMDEKVEFIKKIAEAFDVDLTEVFGK